MQWLRSRPEKKSLVRDCYFDDPLCGAADRYASSAEWNSISNILEGRRGRVLDLGAGNGIASYAFAVSGWDVVAVEPDPSSLVGSSAISSDRWPEEFRGASCAENCDPGSRR